MPAQAGIQAIPVIQKYRLISGNLSIFKFSGFRLSPE
jgi:hypothetical protein